MGNSRSLIASLIAIVATIGVGVYVGAFGSTHPRCQPASADSATTLFAPCQAFDMAAMERPASNRALEPISPAEPGNRPPDNRPADNRPADVASGEHATVGVAGSKP
jgi:hypothetical protein